MGRKTIDDYCLKHLNDLFAIKLIIFRSELNVGTFWIFRRKPIPPLVLREHSLQIRHYFMSDEFCRTIRFYLIKKYSLTLAFVIQYGKKQYVKNILHCIILRSFVAFDELYSLTHV